MAHGNDKMNFFCKNCFADKYLQDLIEKEGEINTCHCCGGIDSKCIDSDRLKELMKPVMSLFERAEPDVGWTAEVDLTEDVSDPEVGHLWYILNGKNVFSNRETAEKILEALYEDNDNVNGNKIELDKTYGFKSPYAGAGSQRSKKLRNKWDAFCDEIKNERRFFPTNPLELPVFKNLIINLTKTFDPNDENHNRFYRARVEKTDTVILPQEMGKPPPDICQNGRVNPVGIPYLYLASIRNTAVAETRPHVGSYVTVGQFDLKKKIKLLDLRTPIIDSLFQYGKDLPVVYEHSTFLSNLSRELSKPINPYKTDLEYLPTQFLAEYIKKDFDGILYDSSISDGYNLAVFDDEEKLKCEKCDGQMNISRIIATYDNDIDVKVGKTIEIKAEVHPPKIIIENNTNQ